MAGQFSASRAPSNTAGLFKSESTSNIGSLQSGVPGVNTGSRFGIGNKPAQAAYGSAIEGSNGHIYRKLEGGGYVDENGNKVSGFSTPAKKLSGGGGGGGGGYTMPQQQQQAATPVEFYLGASPTLKELSLDYGELGKRVLETNKPFAEQFRQFNPQLEAGVRSLSQAGATAAAGQVDRSTMEQTNQTNAIAGFGTGLGGRSGAGRARVARDLALTVPQARQYGANLLAQATGITQQAMAAMMPVSATEIFTTAANQDSINNQIVNQNLLNAWQSQALPGQFDVQKGQYVSFTPGQYSAARPLLPGTTFLEKPKSQGMFAGGNWLAREEARNAQIDRQNEAIRAQASNWVGSAYRPQYS